MAFMGKGVIIVIATVLIFLAFKRQGKKRQDTTNSVQVIIDYYWLRTFGTVDVFNYGLT